MIRQSVVGAAFAFRPVGDTACKACWGQVYSSLRSARAARLGLRSQVWGSDRLEIWTCVVEIRDGFKFIKLLEFVE